MIHVIDCLHHTWRSLSTCLSQISYINHIATHPPPYLFLTPSPTPPPPPPPPPPALPNFFLAAPSSPPITPIFLPTQDMTAVTIPKRPRLPELTLPPQERHYSIPALRKVVFRLQSSNTFSEHVVISLGEHYLHTTKPAMDWHNVLWFLAVLVMLLVFAAISAGFMYAR